MLILKKANIRLAVLLVLFLSTEFGLGPQPAEAEEGGASEAPASGGGGGGDKKMKCLNCAMGKDCLKAPKEEMDCNGKCLTVFFKAGGKYVSAMRGCEDSVGEKCDIKDCTEKPIADYNAKCPGGGPTAPMEPGVEPAPAASEEPPTAKPDGSKRDADAEQPDKVEVCVCDTEKCNNMVKGGVSRMSENQAVILWAVASVIALAPAVLSAPFAVSFPQKI